ncbi:MAG TPA: N-acetylmuramoyl-L-alanine amidase [Firmicutes bacterium]|jgi:N-acetylmuramoyl-L-alanine amidase|nr:N-acetylmuramoyl-L-alanine amidase [Bacillota bacterium]
MQCLVWHVGNKWAHQRFNVLLMIGLTAVLAVWLSWPVVWPALSVALDAGHGGKDPGAIGQSGLYEKTVTLQVARLVQELLIAAGVEALLTRDSDARLDTTQRRDLLARVGIAEEAQVDLLISIHCNAFRLSSVRGPSTFYQAGSAQGKALATHIQQALIAAMGYGRQEPHADDHLITRVSSMPAVIVELGYLTNPADERLLADENFHRRIAQGIVDGILNYAAAPND